MFTEPTIQEMKDQILANSRFICGPTGQYDVVMEKDSMNSWWALVEYDTTDANNMRIRAESKKSIHEDIALKDLQATVAGLAAEKRKSLPNEGVNEWPPLAFVRKAYPNRYSYHGDYYSN